MATKCCPGDQLLLNESKEDTNFKWDMAEAILRSNETCNGNAANKHVHYAGCTGHGKINGDDEQRHMPAKPTTAVPKSIHLSKRVIIPTKWIFPSDPVSFTIFKTCITN
eukprot:Seg6200.1 transcript_id=Seg6200.1/GoldUCD/mRNA.D3Y31 product="hypothetical protein" protein_id=Seg6200.1/GoldUCD/D3Y31